MKNERLIKDNIVDFLQKYAVDKLNLDYSNQVKHLSFAISLSFFLHNQKEKRFNENIKKVINQIESEMTFWESKGLGRAIISTLPESKASYLLFSLKEIPNKLFWQAFFMAEYWHNKEALNLLNQIKENETYIIHWKGNLLSKIGFHKKALPFLMEAKDREPWRYNHYSHLGDILRAMKMNDESLRMYYKGASLLQKTEGNRGDVIHIERCQHGINEITKRQEKSEQVLWSLENKIVEDFELERIRF